MCVLAPAHITARALTVTHTYTVFTLVPFSCPKGGLALCKELHMSASIPVSLQAQPPQPHHAHIGTLQTHAWKHKLSQTQTQLTGINNWLVRGGSVASEYVLGVINAAHILPSVLFLS